MKLWIDDVRPAPQGYEWVKSVNRAKVLIKTKSIEIIDIDHDAGNFVLQGGDYIKLLDWMEQENINDIPIHIHSMNSVGKENMRRIIQHNGWIEV